MQRRIVTLKMNYALFWSEYELIQNNDITQKQIFSPGFQTKVSIIDKYKKEIKNKSIRENNAHSFPSPRLKGLETFKVNPSEEQKLKHH